MEKCIENSLNAFNHCLRRIIFEEKMTELSGMEKTNKGSKIFKTNIIKRFFQTKPLNIFEIDIWPDKHKVN